MPDAGGIWALLRHVGFAKAMGVVRRCVFSPRAGS